MYNVSPQTTAKPKSYQNYMQAMASKKWPARNGLHEMASKKKTWPTRNDK
jgi:hypothetical protein